MRLTPRIITPLLLFCINGSTPADDDLKQLSRSLRWNHIALTDTAPDDLELKLPHETSQLRFAEWVYGTPSSPRVTVVTAQDDSAAAVLYADIDRDRFIDTAEVVPGSGPLRRLSLTAQHVTDNRLHEYPREIMLRYQGDDRLSVATITSADHLVHPDGDQTATPLSCRQLDGNANGLFADGKDLLQIDLNSDQRFDGFLETFPVRPVLRLQGHRWFLKADSFGNRLQLSSATATGRVLIQTALQSSADQIRSLTLTLSGEDGSVFSIDGNNASADLPVGRYSAAVLHLALQHQSTGRAWEFTFSRQGNPRSQDWLHIEENNTIRFDPVGTLSLDATCERSQREGGTLSLQPRLFTESGLLINLCQIEGHSSYSGSQCHVSVIGPNKRVLGQSTSGFA